MARSSDLVHWEVPPGLTDQGATSSRAMPVRVADPKGRTALLEDHPAVGHADLGEVNTLPGGPTPRRRARRRPGGRAGRSRRSSPPLRPGGEDDHEAPAPRCRSATYPELSFFLLDVGLEAEGPPVPGGAGGDVGHEELDVREPGDGGVVPRLGRRGSPGGSYREATRPSRGIGRGRARLRCARPARGARSGTALNGPRRRRRRPWRRRRAARPGRALRASPATRASSARRRMAASSSPGSHSVMPKLDGELGESADSDGGVELGAHGVQRPGRVDRRAVREGDGELLAAVAR